MILLAGCGQEMIEPVQPEMNLKSAKIETDLKLNRIIVKYKDKKEIEILKDIKDISKELEKLSKDTKVEYAEPDFLLTMPIVDDTLFVNGTLWNMYSATSTPANEFGCQAVTAWEDGQTGSSDIWIGIIDQGYNYNHEDLLLNAGQNPFEIPGDGIDNESNGFIDDVYGWDFYNNNNSVFDGNTDFHGTHVAGIIGAKGGNKIGVAGVVWNVRFINAKFMGYYGGFAGDAIKSIYYMIDLKERGLNLVACNNSWGSATKSRALQAAFEEAEQAGIIMVCAAGNAGSNKAHYPASYTNPNIISVASINMGGKLSIFSTYSKRTVDIGAPGEYIWSTYAAAGTSYFSRYYPLSGTSMAAPHVTGACALYKSLHPEATWQEIKEAILNSAVPTPSLAGKVLTGGRLNVSNF